MLMLLLISGVSILILHQSPFQIFCFLIWSCHMSVTRYSSLVWTWFDLLLAMKLP